MGMSEWLVRLQEMPEYQEGYNNPGVPGTYGFGDKRDAYQLGQQDWHTDNAPRTEPDE